MTQRDPQPRRPWIDTGEFARTAQRLEGRWPVSRCERLFDLLTDQDGELSWSLTGERSRRSDGGFDDFLALELSGRVRMPCVRCLEPVEVEIQDQRHYKLAVTESVAAREDAQSEDVDLLVASPHFDVVDLLEDEAIMALPLAPRHADCPAQASLGTDGLPGTPLVREPEDSPGDGSERPNPFAVLARLRKPEPGGERSD